MKLFDNDALIAVLESPASTEWVFQEPSVPVVVPTAIASSLNIPYIFLRHPNIDDADCDDLGLLSNRKLSDPLAFASSTLGPRTLTSPPSTSAPSTPTKGGVSNDPASVEIIPFPLPFVCDMAPGMEKLKGLRGAAIERGFSRAFPNSPFKPKTVYKHMAIYAVAVEKDLVPCYIGYGATKKGLWAELRTKVEAIKAADAGT